MLLFTKRLSQYLNNLKENDPIVIWGCGELGVDLKQYITDAYPHLKILGFIDSFQPDNVKRQLDGLDIFPTSQLNDLNFELLIISAVQAEDEIVHQIKQEWPDLVDKVFYMGKSYQHIYEQADQMLQSADYQGLVSLAYEYPELKKVWQCLAKLSDKNEEKDLFNKVSQILY